jgi:hypothetical protein
LISLEVKGGPANESLYALTQPIGVLTKHADVQFPSVDQYAINVSDMQFPTAGALVKVSALIAQGAKVVVSTTAVGSATFAANDGVASLYTLATAATTPGAAVFNLQVTRGSAEIFSDIRAVSAPGATSKRAFAFTTSLPSKGLYRFQLKDFGFPSAIASLHLLAAQKEVKLGTLAMPGSIDAAAEAGPMNLLVLVDAGSTNTLGLLGLSVDTTQPSVVRVFDAVQPVGDLLHTTKLPVTTTGSIDVALSDLGFPVGFGDLALAVTRGSTVVGQIFGGGKLSFDAVPGEYSLNLIARNAAKAGFGLYGLKVEDSPPPPVVTLTASPTTVSSGAMVSLTWTSTGATSCVASGGWSGTQLLSGSMANIGPLATDTTMTLTCVGAGGSNSASAKVSVSAPTAQSGSGSFDLVLLLGMALLLGIRSLGIRSLRARFPLGLRR